MSGTCKDCKHWHSFAAWWEEEGQYGYDSPDEVYSEWARRRYGSCNLAESNGDNPKNPETKAIAIDGERYSASLMTAPDFGCNQFQAKD